MRYHTSLLSHILGNKICIYIYKYHCYICRKAILSFFCHQRLLCVLVIKKRYKLCWPFGGNTAIESLNYQIVVSSEASNRGLVIYYMPMCKTVESVAVLFWKTSCSVSVSVLRSVVVWCPNSIWHLSKQHHELSAHVCFSSKNYQNFV